MVADDDQDEVDRRVKAALVFGLGLLIKHPDIDPARITAVLKIEPKLAGMVGSPRITPVGKRRPGVYKESVWSHWFDIKGNRFFFADVAKMIGTLEPHKAFLREIVRGAALSI